jgi:hypothetical protein
MSIELSYDDKLLINLSFLIPKPTDTTNYALNILPYFQKIEPILLTSQSLSNFNCYQVPNNQTPAQGAKGHLHRLLWTQFQCLQKYSSNHCCF